MTTATSVYDDSIYKGLYVLGSKNSNVFMTKMTYTVAELCTLLFASSSGKFEITTLQRFVYFNIPQDESNC